MDCGRCGPGDFYRESAKAAQFDAVAISKGIGDLFKNRADDVFDIALEKMRITAGDNLNEFRFDHGFKPLCFSCPVKGLIYLPE